MRSPVGDVQEPVQEALDLQQEEQVGEVAQVEAAVVQAEAERVDQDHQVLQD